MRIPRLVAQLGIIAFGLLLALLLAEVGLRVLLPRLGAGPSGRVRPAIQLLPLPYNTRIVDAIAEGEGLVTFDQGLGWEPTPDLDMERPIATYRHNHGGIRADREYGRTPSSGVRRFAAYGDSFTYCAEVDFEDCWTSRLESLLPNSEVLNFGVPGYGPDQAWLRYQRDGATWRPCAVLIGVMTENIQRVVNRFRGFLVPEESLALPKPRYELEAGNLVLVPSPIGRPEELRDPVRVESSLGPQDAWYFPGIFVANPLDRLEVVRLARTAVYRSRLIDGSTSWSLKWAARMYRPEGEAFQVLVEVLAHFADDVRADGATPVVTVFPPYPEIAAQRDGLAKTHAPLLAALAERGIPTVDLTNALGEEAHRTPVDQLERRGGHYRPPGNAVVARALAEGLPAPTSATCMG